MHTKTEVNPKVRAVLDQIDEVLTQRDDTSQNLWDVLTALRGPDSDDPAIKSFTTAVIRSKAFPKAAKNATSSRSVEFAHADGFGYVNGAEYAGAGREFTPSMLDGLPSFDHFSYHTRAAARVLGLIEEF